MKKTKKSYKNIWAIAIVGLLAIFLFLIIAKKQTQVISVPDNQNSTILSPIIKSNFPRAYHSDFLKITINIPENFTIKEINALREMILVKDGGEIKIHRFGTNRYYKNIKELLDEIYKSDDSYKDITRKKIRINDKECEISIRTNTSTLNSKTYDCYLSSNSFLSISTKSPKLYSDLDQIAQSFRYAP